MLRTTNLVLGALILIVGAITYIVKYGTKIEYNAISRLERQIKVEKEAIDILNANWALLTNPSRIQSLVERHNDELKLKSLSPDQVIDVNQIPLKLPINKEDIDERMVGDPKVDSDILTGSIKHGGRE